MQTFGEQRAGRWRTEPRVEHARPLHLEAALRIERDEALVDAVEQALTPGVRDLELLLGARVGDHERAHDDEQDRERSDHEDGAKDELGVRRQERRAHDDVTAEEQGERQADRQDDAVDHRLAVGEATEQQRNAGGRVEEADLAAQTERAKIDERDGGWQGQEHDARRGEQPGAVEHDRQQKQQPNRDEAEREQLEAERPQRDEVAPRVERDNDRERVVHDDPSLAPRAGREAFANVDDVL